jgi:hypothetical protein
VQIGSPTRRDPVLPVHRERESLASTAAGVLQLDVVTCGRVLTRVAAGRGQEGRCVVVRLELCISEVEVASGAVEIR